MVAVDEHDGCYPHDMFPDVRARVAYMAKLDDEGRRMYSKRDRQSTGVGVPSEVDVCRSLASVDGFGRRWTSRMSGPCGRREDGPTFELFGRGRFGVVREHGKSYGLV
jgi:hypothetical protein